MPWLANSNLPGLCWIAPVKAPRSKPNSSDSSSSVGQRRAVHLDERLVAPERGGAERPRDQLLAGAALAANQHRDVGVGDALDQVAHLGHPLAVAEQHAGTCDCDCELLAQRRHLATELPLLERVGERHFEIGLVERLADEVGGAELHRLHDGRRPALAREHDDRDVAIDLLERGERLEPVHRARHHHVEDDGRRPLGVVALDRLFGVAERDRADSRAR